MPTTRPADQWSPLHYLAATGADGGAVTLFHGVLLLDSASRPAGPGVRGHRRRAGGFWRSERGAGRLPGRHADDGDVGFVLGMAFVPELWTVVAYLVPAAAPACPPISAMALRQLGGFLNPRDALWWAGNAAEHFFFADAAGLHPVGLHAHVSVEDGAGAGMLFLARLLSLQSPVALFGVAALRSRRCCISVSTGGLTALALAAQLATTALTIVLTRRHFLPRAA